MSGPGGDVAVAGPASGWNKLIRRFNRLFLNPLMLFAAGRLRRSYPAVVHHVGRHSGRAYRTPVVAQPVTGGFVIPLPYGTDTEWCRNALAAGRFTIERSGRIYDVTNPEVIGPDEALPLVPERARKPWRRFRIKAFLRVTALGPAERDGTPPR